MMTKSPLSLTSPAFENGGIIPSMYTCDLPAGRQVATRHVSPPLAISGVSAETKSLALIMDDHDVPKALRPDGIFDHWILFNIPPETREIPEGATIGVAGINSAGTNAYTGPCPPPEYEPKEHQYRFTLYALSAPLTLPAGATKTEVLDALRPLVIAEAELLGRYART